MRKTIKKVAAMTLVGAILVTTGTPSNMVFSAEELENTTQETTETTSTSEEVITETEVSTEVKISEEITTETATSEEEIEVRSLANSTTEEEVKASAKVTKVELSGLKTLAGKKNVLYCVEDTEPKITIEYNLTGIDGVKSVEMGGVSASAISNTSAVFMAKDLEGVSLEKIKITEDATENAQSVEVSTGDTLKGKIIRKPKAPELIYLNGVTKDGQEVDLLTSNNRYNSPLSKISLKLKDSGSGYIVPRVLVDGTSIELEEGANEGEYTANVDTLNWLSADDIVLSVTLRDNFNKYNKYICGYSYGELTGKPKLSITSENAYADPQGNIHIIKTAENQVSGKVSFYINSTVDFEVLEDGNTIKKYSKGKYEDSITLSEDHTYRVAVKVTSGGISSIVAYPLIGDSSLETVIILDNDGLCDVTSVGIDGTDVKLGDKTFAKGATKLVIGKKDPDVTVNWCKIGNTTLPVKDNGTNCTVSIKDIRSLIDSSGLFSETIKFLNSNKTQEGKGLSYTIYLDDKSPVVSNIKTKGTFNNVNGESYCSKKSSVSFDVEDTASGIKSIAVEVDDGVDQSMEVLPVTSTSSTSTSFNMSRSGKYTLVVTDNVDNTKRININEELGWGDTIHVDTDGAPKVSLTDGLSEITKNLWINKFIDIVLGLSDESGIRDASLEVTHDGKTIVSAKGGNKEAISNSIELSDSLNKSGATDGVYTIKYEAEDNAGEKTSDEVSINIDTTAPSDVKSTFSSLYNIVDGVAYFKETPTLTIKATDNNGDIIGSGIEKYIISDGTTSRENTSGIFTDLVSGTYTVEVVDNVGNTTGKIALKDTIAGLTTDTIRVDSEDPVAVGIKPDGDYNSWYAKDVIYSAKLTDDTGLRSGKVTINNSVVSEYTSTSSDEKEYTISASTAGVAPNEDGSYNIHVEVKDNAGRTGSFDDVIYIDKDKPVVDKIVFSGEGYQEGKHNGSQGVYGFYFKGSAKCDIYVSDGKASSGLNNIKVKLEDNGKDAEEKTVAIKNGVGELSIPEGFKGRIYITASDMVGNISDETQPDGIITENSNTSVNKIDISISLPDTDYKDANGVSLYSKSVNATAKIKSPLSGVREIEWGINDTSSEKITIDNNGNPSSSKGLTVSSKEKNLTVDLSNALSVANNENNIKLWVSVTDRAGVVSKVERRLSIDKDDPEISISYDKNGSKYYNTNRVATITVKERNFNPKLFTLTTSSKASHSGWSKDGNNWVSKVTYSKDGDYRLSASCVDRAGNQSKVYSGSRFTVDKTKPQLTVNWSNGNASNGKYYNASRTATLVVKEHNFNAKLIQVTGGTVGGWSNSGDTHTATVSFSGNGTYKLGVTGKDSAGNVMNSYSGDEFVIDVDKPTLKITGVEKGVSYKKDFSAKVVVSDNGLDTSASIVTVTGKRNGKMNLTGSFSSNGGTISFDNLPKEEKYDDVYTVKAIAKDLAGNSVEEEMVFSVNRFGSAYKFMTEDILGNYIKDKKDVKITERNIDEVDTSKSEVVVLFNGDKIEVPDNAVSIKDLGEEDGKHIYEYTVNKDVFDKDGKYLVQIFSVNRDGTKYDSATEEYAFVLDTTNPVVIISGVKDNGVYNEYEKKATVEIRDLSGIKDMNISLNGKDIKYTEKDGIYTLSIPESSNAQELSVNVTDRAGNETTSSVKNIIVSSSRLVYLSHQLWFRVIVGLLGVFILAGICILIGYRLKSKKSLDKDLEDSIKEYNSSSNSSGEED